MTDRYERIRAALAMGPTPGPWSPSYDKGSTRDIFTEQGKLPVCMVRGVTYVGQEQYLANGYFIAACDPDTIRELLAERDALADALEAAREDAERMRRDIADLYKVMPMLPITAETMEAATDWFERYCIEFYREINAALDAAIDQARGKENTNG